MLNNRPLNTLNYYILAAMLWFTYASMAYGQTRPYDIDTATWMRGLPDTVELDNIVLPGSHDAGMSMTEHCDVLSKELKGYVLAQGGPIDSQLDVGSRYFDLRIDYDHGELVTYHRTLTIGCNGQSFQNILGQIQRFLTAHPSETVIVKISHIRSGRGEESLIKEKINSMLRLSPYNDKLYKNYNSELNLARVTLGNVRGKMIFVFDYSEYINPSSGRFRYKDGYKNDACITQNGANLTVCDSYSDTANYEKMKRDQLKKWETVPAGAAGNFFLLSWTLTPDPLTNPTIKALAAEANANLPGVLHDQLINKKAVKPNVVYIDFMNSATARSIIQYNFPPKKPGDEL